MKATAGQVAAAVLLPPLGVFLVRGIGSAFWIATGLTVVAFVPGVIFALWTVVNPPRDREGDQPQANEGGRPLATT